MRNSLTFGGVNSRDYGIYITGKGVHDAPKRVVEKIVIPGRNGALAIDQGRYENIVVTYPAFAFGKNREEFQGKIDAFRNAVAAQIGYQRLEDTYRPDEYRMALFDSGVEVDIGPYGATGKFELRFECKPQRFLKDGEIPIEIENGEQTVINPTEHTAEPLIAVRGNGVIGVNGQEMVLNDAQVGYVQIAEESFWDASSVLPLDLTLVNDTDDIDMAGLGVNIYMTCGYTIASITFEDLASGVTASFEPLGNGRRGIIQILIPTLSLRSSQSFRDSFIMRITVGETEAVLQAQGAIEIRIRNSALRFMCSASGASASYNVTTAKVESVSAISTKSVLGDPTYIDCEIGEAYKIEGDEYISLDGYIELGSDPPKLANGENEITYSGNVTELTVIPRWWRI